MLLTSPAYFALLGLVFFAYWPATRNRFGVLSVVLFANLFFYAKWDLRYLLIVPAASLADFIIALLLDRTASDGSRRALITTSVLINIGLIASLRWQWALPLALSFYAFQSLTYTIDVYRRDAKPVRSYLTYLCCSSFFPCTLAGPITRLSSL